MTGTRDRILESAQALVIDHGFASTTIDSVLAASGTSKGAFFHHFPSKAHLGRALVERYAAADAELLESTMVRAEHEAEDPAAQLIAFVRAFEEMASVSTAEQPSCLFVSFIYEGELADAGTDALVRSSILAWRNRILEKVEAAAARRPGFPPVDRSAVADQFFTTVEGAFLLMRALGDVTRMGAQLAQYRLYLELLFASPVEG